MAQARNTKHSLSRCNYDLYRSKAPRVQSPFSNEEAIKKAWDKNVLQYWNFYVIAKRYNTSRIKLTFGFDIQYKIYCVGHGGGAVVTVLAFYSNDPSSNAADVYNFL